MGPLLFDLGCVCERHTDGALEYIFKASGEDPPSDDLWAPHPNPYVRRLLELMTERGLRRVEGLETELQRWLRGEEYREGAALDRPPRPAGAMERWSAGEIGLTAAYLRALPPDQWTPDDYRLLIEFLAQRYLPAADLRAEADWAVSRANMMGRVEAALATPDINVNLADRLLASRELEEAARRYAGSREQRATIVFGRERCAEHVRGWSEAGKARLRGVIVDWQEATYLGDRTGAAHDLQTRLLDTFGMMNRDWRRIAVTEVTENANQGFISACGPGSRVRRVEKYRGACAFCRSINGLVFDVVDAATPRKDGATQIWVGKTNVGRSASPRKRVGGALVEREPDELWWVAAGVIHPHCRGSWVKETGVTADPEFEAFVENMRRNRGRPADEG